MTGQYYGEGQSGKNEAPIFFAFCIEDVYVQFELSS